MMKSVLNLTYQQFLIRKQSALKMTLSQGAKKDMMVLLFAKSLIEVSTTAETKTDQDLLNRIDNKNYHLNKKIDRGLLKLKDKLDKTITLMYEIGGHDLAKWTKINLHKRVGGTLTSIQYDTINLELLSLYVLYVNFSEHEKKLHDNFKWLQDAEQYFKLSEMITKTVVGEIEEILFKIANDSVSRIKA